MWGKQIIVAVKCPDKARRTALRFSYVAGCTLLSSLVTGAVSSEDVAYLAG